MSAKKLTWFTKGLRRRGRYPAWDSGYIKETDLIYEGIATNPPTTIWSDIITKETDLIYEGIATSLYILIPRVLERKETDLIYEGIATENPQESPLQTDHS